MNLLSLYKFFRQKCIRLRESIFFGAAEHNPIACDFWLVCHEKDYETAKLCIQSIRRFSLNPVNKIFFVSNLTTKPVWLDGDIKYVYERDIIGINEVLQILEGNSYRGWIVQQILKLSGKDYSTKFVCIDCDTVLLNPHLFFSKEKTILRLAYEYSPIYKPFEKILGISIFSQLSFVCHMMPFDSWLVQKLVGLIEEKFQKKWFIAIAEYAEMSGMVISEWDLYARYLIKNNYPYKLNPWRNLTVQYSPKMSLDSLISAHGSRRLSVSIHQSGGPLVLK